MSKVRELDYKEMWNILKNVLERRVKESTHKEPVGYVAGYEQCYNTVLGFMKDIEEKHRN